MTKKIGVVGIGKNMAKAVFQAAMGVVQENAENHYHEVGKPTKLETMVARNQRIQKTFNIVHEPTVHLDAQYFIVYINEEGGAVSGAVGFIDADMGAHIISRYEQTGILVKPVPTYQRAPRYVYHEVGQPVAIYLTKATDLLHRIPRFEMVDDDHD